MAGASARRVSPVGRLILALALLAGSGLVAYYLVDDFSDAAKLPGRLIDVAVVWGRDFANLWSGGRLSLEGNLAALYDIDAYRAWQREALDPGLAWHNYSYPPTSLLYAWAFALLPYEVALALFLLLSAGAFWWAARPWLREARLPTWLALVLPSTLFCLWAGHYGLLFGALWLFAWRTVDRDPRASGIATGLMIIKPHLAILMPLLYARRGAWRAFAWAAATVGVLVGLSVLLFGTGLWHTYLTATSRDQLDLIDASHTFFGYMMADSVISALALGASHAMAWALQALAAVIGIALVLVRPPKSAEAMGLLGAVTTFLVLPYSFAYDMTVVGLAGWLVSARALAMQRIGLAAIALCAMVLPAAMLSLSGAGIRVAPFVLLAFALLLWKRPDLAGGR